MAARWIEAVTGPLEQKKQYRLAKKRLESLPEPYRAAASGVNRYLLYYSGITDGDTIVQMFVDLVDLWERAALDHKSIEDVVGEDVVEFSESLAHAYGGRQWIDKERERLIKTIDDAKKGGSR